MDKYARLEQIEKKSMPGSRGEANLVIKCKLCSRVNSAGLASCCTYLLVSNHFFPTDLIPNSTAAYRQEDSDKYKTIVQLECRGIEPTDCFMGQGFIVTSEAGTTFADVNLEEGEWVDYDERSNSSVGVYGLQHQFVKV